MQVDTPRPAHRFARTNSGAPTYEKEIPLRPIPSERKPARLMPRARQQVRREASGPSRARLGEPRHRTDTRSAVVDRDELEAFRQGDAAGVRALYRAYGRLVYAVAHRVLGTHELAEEATQQTFVRAWQAADRIDVDRDPAAWLATISKRTAIDIYRREARRPKRALADVPVNDPALVTLPPDLGALDAVWHVRRAIDELPDDEATIVRLQHLDGLTQHEIAGHLGLALGTVKSRSHRAHQRLAAILGHLREAPA
jgi:RNA polymerase sigma-70 factor (ECF subfamily)